MTLKETYAQAKKEALERARRVIAEYIEANPDLTINEVAVRLGFSYSLIAQVSKTTSVQRHRGRPRKVVTQV